MNEENGKDNKSFEYETNNLIRSNFNEKESVKELENIAPKPSNQLTNGLLGWYSVSSSESIKEGKLNHFTIYNEPLVLYRDREGIVRCVKDVCPHRGASFLGGEVINGQLVCPYHGARFSSQGSCTNLDRITCQHIIDSNYDNYAKSIKLFQYPCVEKEGYIYIYYTGKPLANIEDFQIKSSINSLLPDSYGFPSLEYEYEEVYVDFKADWARIIENHLDILHVFWMHGDTIPDKNVNRETITSFNQKIKRDNRQIESIYSYKTNGQEEFIRIKFVPPGRIFIYKGSPESTRYIQVLDHIPLGNNKARVIVRHYRKFLKNKFFTNLVLFSHLQRRTFYKIFTEDYLVLKTQTFNDQMGYIQKDNVKLLGEDKMVQYYWDWLQNALNKEKPWDLHPTNSLTNSVHEDRGMQYPPENPNMAIKNDRKIIIKLLTRLLFPISFILLLI